ncbi:MAG: hypothetical protein RI884_1687, partial [Pseudomonadota bacterium]
MGKGLGKKDYLEALEPLQLELK